MKSLIATACLTLCLVTLVVSASAQQTLNFSSLPLVNTPTPMPNGYGQLDWGNFFYVNPYGWSGAGSGYKLGPQGEDVAFIGGEYCRINGYTCVGTLTDSRGFVPVSAQVAGGFGPAVLTVSAYNNGNFIGSENYQLTTDISTLTFPSAWGVVTEISIQARGEPGDVVVYSLSLYTFGG
ncbi:MAG: hypothetical protein ACLPPV_24510 [Candidatus Korobacteraceae bacterium]|jgi:hypothetical protein